MCWNQEMLLLVILMASLGYLFEYEAQPEKFENIPTSIYWAVITLASVGYGDISPVTPIGRARSVPWLTDLSSPRDGFQHAQPSHVFAIGAHTSGLKLNFSFSSVVKKSQSMRATGHFLCSLTIA
jgi:hypothetical protein